MSKFKDPSRKLAYTPRLLNRGSHKSLKKRNEKIVSMFNEGIAIQKIADEMNLKRTTLFSILRRENLSATERIKKRNEKIVSMFNEGISYKKIGGMMKLNVSSVGAILKKHNLSSNENIKKRNERIVPVYKEEMNIKKTAQIMEISKNMVFSVLKKENISTGLELKEKYRKIEAYYKQGLSIDEISKIVNLKSERIRQILAINGVRKLKILVKGEDRKELIKNIHKDLIDGLSYSELAKKYNYTILSVKQVINKNKLPHPHSIILNKRNKLMIDAMKSGRTVDSIAAEFKLNRNFIYQICRENGYHQKQLIRDRVKKLSEKGLTPNQIASELKVTSKAVTYHLRRFKKQKETK